MFWSELVSSILLMYIIYKQETPLRALHAKPTSACGLALPQLFMGRWLVFTYLFFPHVIKRRSLQIMSQIGIYLVR